MRIVIISDTHERQDAFGRLNGDVLIHCGDMFDLFGPAEVGVADLDRWFGQQDFDIVLCTGGNHDLPLAQALQSKEQPFRNAVYLQDSGYEHNGRLFWGAPWVPLLSRHAFYAPRTERIQSWSLIPENVDVLVTHTPPRAVLDRSSSGSELGCPHLMDAVQRTRPALHCFGHVHHSRGEFSDGATRFVNASSIQRGVRDVLPPIVIDL